MKKLIVIPTYNEAENIGRILPEVLKYSPDCDVMVVDDNSPDGTGKIVEYICQSEKRVRLLKREKKEGLALAYLHAFDLAIKEGYDAILQMDADFSHSPSDVPKLFEALKTHDVAIGSRYVYGGGTSGWTWPRKMISRGGNLYAQMVLGTKVIDMTGGFNAWRSTVLKSLELDTVKSKGYAYQVELKYRAFKRGFSIKEIPILFLNRRFGYSKMSKEIIREAAFRVFQMKNFKFA